LSLNKIVIPFLTGFGKGLRELVNSGFEDVTFYFKKKINTLKIGYLMGLKGHCHLCTHNAEIQRVWGPKRPARNSGPHQVLSPKITQL